ncbi:uncharacterized protein LOC111248113 isoform X1 [Varroa destructor]|uniref:Uncharacterized protein n=1 Tax=Varroa destructor TaxID=109461 RepID=A0A7M7JTZ7_VARDE|nr:uncharacterized protein LOC111248113 isoform X1 [Varroa destructor]
MKFVLLAIAVISAVDGHQNPRNQAVTFLSAHNGWHVRESNSVSVNPQLSISPSQYSPSPNQRIVLVSGGPDQAIPAMAVTGSSTRGLRGSRRRYDLDSLVITPLAEDTESSDTPVAASVLTITFVPVPGRTTDECMVARFNSGNSNAVNGIDTNVSPTRATCVIFVRNDNNTGLLGSREMLKCKAALRKCGRGF